MKLTKVVLALMLCASPVMASDSLLGKVWGDLSASENFHLLDNAAPVYLYDFKNKEHLAGGVTSLYEVKKYYTSIEFGGAKSMESDTTFPFGGVNFKFGDLLADKTPAKALAEKYGKHKLLGKLTIAGWGGRDFNAGVWRAGIYSGFEFKW